MPSELEFARVNAERLRFSGDKGNSDAELALGDLTLARDCLNRNELCITKEVVPKLHYSLSEVYARLQIPEAAVAAFVYPDSDIQAACISGKNSECVMRFSSTLIETFDLDEFEFVAGHELGHFLLGHGTPHTYKETLGHFMQMRAREISADRIGLLACGSIDAAAKSMMKSTSGLSSKYLRFNVRAFISQIKNNTSVADAHATHPSMAYRCRALLRFNSNENYTVQDIAKINERIEKDLLVYNKPFIYAVKQAKQQLALWVAVRIIAEDDNFSKSEQNKFQEEFGEAKLKSLRGYLPSIPKSKRQEVLGKKIQSASEDLWDLIPDDFETEVKQIKKHMRDKLK